MAAQAAEYREKLVDAVVETDEALMERYLEGEEIGGRGARGARSKTAVARGELFPVACGVATQNLGTTGLLDLLVEGVPSPAEEAARPRRRGERRRRLRLQDRRRPVRRADHRLPRPLRHGQAADSTLVNPRTKGKERLGQLLLLQGKEHAAAPTSSAPATSAPSRS